MDFYKKYLLILLIVFSFCNIVGCTHSKNSEDTNSEDMHLSKIVEEVEEKEYNQIMLELCEKTIRELENIKPTTNSENAYVYFGRATCSYCREFVIKNKELLMERKDFYYVDTEKITKNEKKLLETYGIDEIPAVIEITNSKNMKLVDIEKFIEELIDEN